jgi:hypothetical protein
MGCVQPKKKTPVAVVQPSNVPAVVANNPSTYYNQQSTVTRTAMPLPNGSTMYGPPQTVPPVTAQNPLSRAPPERPPPPYQLPTLGVSNVIPPLEITHETIRQQGIAGPVNPNVGRQPLIKQGNQSVEVPAHLRDAVRNMNFTPVQINPMGGPNYDVNSNYAMEATQVGGVVNTMMDQRVMDLDMDMGSSNQTPKIYTYTYGNMMSTGGPLMGGPAGPRAAAY